MYYWTNHPKKPLDDERPARILGFVGVVMAVGGALWAVWSALSS